MLFNEPKLLKVHPTRRDSARPTGFSALQRAEIAETGAVRAEPEEIEASFSALQRAEIAETALVCQISRLMTFVSVLFNEPKLLKCAPMLPPAARPSRFSALQRAEIAETVQPDAAL